MREMVVGFLFSLSGDCVVLIERPKGKSHAGFFNGVGGKIEPKELPIEAMVREFKEEAGLKITADKWTHNLTFYCKDMKNNPSTIHVFSCFSPLFNAVKTQDEGTVTVVPVRDILNNKIKTISNLKFLIPIILDLR